MARGNETTTKFKVDISELKKHLLHIDGVEDVHHIHVWSMDGQSSYATMHIVSSGDYAAVKQSVREELKEHNIRHATLELEGADEHCHSQSCCVEMSDTHAHHHHHHHHHHH